MFYICSVLGVFFSYANPPFAPAESLRARSLIIESAMGRALSVLSAIIRSYPHFAALRGGIIYLNGDAYFIALRIE